MLSLSLSLSPFPWFFWKFAQRYRVCLRKEAQRADFLGKESVDTHNL